MKAVGIMKHGGPEALEVLEVPEVQAGPGQIRIRNYAAAVNPTDVAARNGLMAEFQKKNPPPYVPGMDAAGIVDQLGDLLIPVPERLELMQTLPPVPHS